MERCQGQASLSRIRDTKLSQQHIARSSPATRVRPTRCCCCIGALSMIDRGLDVRHHRQSVEIVLARMDYPDKSEAARNMVGTRLLAFGCIQLHAESDHTVLNRKWDGMYPIDSYFPRHECRCMNKQISKRIRAPNGERYIQRMLSRGLAPTTGIFQKRKKKIKVMEMPRM